MLEILFTYELVREKPFNGIDFTLWKRNRKKEEKGREKADARRRKRERERETARLEEKKRPREVAIVTRMVRFPGLTVPFPTMTQQPWNLVRSWCSPSWWRVGRAHLTKIG